MAEIGSCHTSVIPASISASAPVRISAAASARRARRERAERRSGTLSDPAGVFELNSIWDTAYLSSQSRLGATQRAWAGVRQRAADRDLELLLAARAGCRRMRRDGEHRRG